MKRNRVAAVLAIVAVLAVSLISHRWLATDDGPSIKEKAREYVAEWQNSAMYLPEQEECEFFGQNFSETKMILVESLSHQRHEVRMRGAFVIDKIGTEARSLSHAVIDSLSTEKHELVRIYLINAARSAGKGDAAVLDSLRKLFGVPTNEDERVYIAAALFVLNDNSDERATAEEFVCDYLLPYEKTDQRHSAVDYDGLRWSAVNAVQHMVGATKPIPLLEDMLSESGAKPWVRAHVPRALKVLRTAGAFIETQPAAEGREEGSTKP